MPTNGNRINGGGRVAVPPGGFAGVAQQTPAAQATTVAAGGFGGGPVRRIGVNSAPTRTMYRKPKRGGITPRRPRRNGKRARSHSRPAYMVKGSKAAKARMAKLRRMQKARR